MDSLHKAAVYVDDYFLMHIVSFGKLNPPTDTSSNGGESGFSRTSGSFGVGLLRNNNSNYLLAGITHKFLLWQARYIMRCWCLIVSDTGGCPSLQFPIQIQEELC